MTTEERALQIWTVLVGCAHRRETITYKALAKLIGFDAPANRLARMLGCVMRYCDRRGFPPLTVLVVRGSGTEMGKPGDGLATSTNHDQDRERVYSYRWFRQTPLQREDMT